MRPYWITLGATFFAFPYGIIMPQANFCASSLVQLQSAITILVFDKSFQNITSVLPHSDQASKMAVIYFFLTQWLSQLNVMTAGPKERAGFMLAPV